jgi:cation transport ATPase
MLTGESKLVTKALDSKVFGGTMLVKGSLIVRVNKLGENSAINQIMKLVE